MSITRFSFPTIIHFGAGARALAGPHLTDLGLRRPLIVTDKGLAALPLMSELKQILLDSYYGRPYVDTYEHNSAEEIDSTVVTLRA